MLGEWVLYRINEPQKLKDVARVQDRFEFQFCQVAHVLHTEEPYRMAFFKDLISASGCDNHREHKRMNWDQAEQYLESQRAENKVIPPTGFLHHEARCGSTLVTNILASNPRAIAYSEPPAVVNAGGKVCRDCPREIRVRLLQLAVGLMGLSAKHDYVFFKLMPSNMLEADLFKEAFPTTPYIWIHRDPVGVMMSQLKVERPPDHNAFNDQSLPGMPMLQAGARHRGGKRGGLPAPPSKGGNVGGLPPCLRRLKEVDDSLGIALKSKEEMPSREEYCAEYLAVTSRAAVEAMATDPLGMPVAYEQEPDLATHVIDFLLPMFFGVQLDEDARQRAVVVSRSYSKGSRFRRVEDGGSYAGDVAKKRDAAWPNLVAEAGEHTRGVYERLVAMEREKVVALRQLSAGRGWLGQPR
uniref:Protein-tyrosine sulfotransferase n=1 Tax=Heterosigma akashiwo TaxID=2829 RepID=A0A7S3XRV5_HETAK